ncbi:MAG: 2-succinyl-6-hydroxy-2,4-cyclohexadiene-1-carboxylate synthase [Gracilimonas sp.]|nr:2-succinyl-6-hydroxy-2,4-cyclohexadiene-1-carboxylate synthase [Gracilimonas sp.]
MNIKVRGVAYHFDVHQDKPELPTLVLLHGFMGSGRVFDHLIKDLKQYCNPVTIDLLGHGRSEGAELHYRFSTKEQVADLSKLISEQLKVPLFLYGYSMGGRLGLQLAAHRANLFKGLILESATFGLEGETERQARQALDARRADAIVGNYQGFLAEWQEKPMFRADEIASDLMETMLKIQKDQNPFWLSNSLLGFGTGTMPCVKERLNNVRIPVQLLAGKNDSKFLHINNQMEKELPNAEFTVVEDAGHRVHLEQPEKLNTILKTFIQNHSGS